MKVRSAKKLEPCVQLERADGLQDVFIRRNIAQGADEGGNEYWEADEVQLTGVWQDGYPETHQDELWIQAEMKAMSTTDRFERIEAIVEYVAIMADVEIEEDNDE
jgi:hypothetical protein